jgi:phage recombination protein Bet
LLLLRYPISNEVNNEGKITMSNITEVQKYTAPSLLSKIANRYSVDPQKMLGTLKATAFKGDVSNEQMMALLVVADQYGLNPFTKEIYAFPDRQQGIVPVVGVDGWARIINSHPQFDGMTFLNTEDGCVCKIYRKDRAHPTEVIEYLSECKRETGPWKSHPRRMLRHKAMIQCARIAFGFVGIYDQDEAEHIVERDITPHDDPLPITSRTQAVKEKIKKAKAETIDQETGEIDTQDEDLRKLEMGAVNSTTELKFADVADQLVKAKTLDDVDVARDLIQYVKNQQHRDELGETVIRKLHELEGDK